VFIGRIIKARDEQVSTGIDDYLHNVKSSLRLEESDETEVIRELADHIEDEVRELKKNGLHDEEAVSTSIRLLGSAKSVGRKIYEAHSQGTWRQALLTSLPHTLFAILFILNWWRGLTAALILLIAIMSTAVYGWWHRKSGWLFPWIGYSLLPVIIAGLSLIYLPAALSWIAFIVYIPLTLWLIIRVITQTMKKDWLYLSLMLLPMPAIIGWFIATEWLGNFDAEAEARLYYDAPWIGTSFLALAFGVITFVRIRRRWLKIGVLFMSGAIAITLISSYARGRLDFIVLLLLILFLVSIFLVPALLENGVRTGRWGKYFEHRPMS
jgi:hypothetical protein